ncbi:hypothetical protein R1sor_008234 [Riccia sorocarpa]|uniref:Uncharacterized protein n=1 Tax=Riccia sorocarpa TaxID=122646 RepID=A0ABD3HT56_9MARC
MRLRKKSVDVNYCDETRTFSKKSSWNWKDYVKDTNWFATVCNLPSAPGGLIPPEISDQTVSVKELRECFTTGPQGFKLNPSMFIPVAELREIVGIVDGPLNLKRNRMDIAMAKGIYADRMLGLSVNWALYAHHKHKEQLQRAWRTGRPPPRESPLVRLPIWYSRPPPVNRKAKDDFTLKDFKLKDPPMESGPPGYNSAGGSTSIEIVGYNPGPEVAYPCESLKSDAAADTQRCSNGTHPVERQTSNGTDQVDEQCPSYNPDPGHIPGFDDENVRTETYWQNTDHENVRTEAPADTAANPSLISMLTPERIQMEISSLTWQQYKLQQDISVLRGILEVYIKMCKIPPASS